tara:strand:+ start:66 stop:509 length:444 start_codon:yes stop_codon:yes gene_type:complete
MKYVVVFFLFNVTLAFSQTKTFGEDIANQKIISTAQVAGLYSSTEKFNTSFKAKVTDVCQVKGCWMKLDIGNDNQVMVNFKDYGFFVPKDIKGKEVIVSGEAYMRNISVEELRHYARDRGESESSIQEINDPKEILSLKANGVILFN